MSNWTDSIVSWIRKNEHQKRREGKTCGERVNISPVKWTWTSSSDVFVSRLLLQWKSHIAHTHTHTCSSCSHRNEGKANKRGWGREWVSVGPRGHSGVQTLKGLHIKERPQRSGLHWDERTNNAARHSYLFHKICQSGWKSHFQLLVTF